jgi:hypothetical protein
VALVHRLGGEEESLGRHFLPGGDDTPIYLSECKQKWRIRLKIPQQVYRCQQNTTSKENHSI